MSTERGLWENKRPTGSVFINADNRHVIAVAGIHPQSAILEAAAVAPPDSGQSSPGSVSFALAAFRLPASRQRNYPALRWGLSPSVR